MSQFTVSTYLLLTFGRLHSECDKGICKYAQLVASLLASYVGCYYIEMRLLHALISDRKCDERRARCLRDILWCAMIGLSGARSR